jgi:hypothetical protein
MGGDERDGGTGRAASVVERGNADWRRRADDAGEEQENQKHIREEIAVEKAERLRDLEG